MIKRVMGISFLMAALLAGFNNCGREGTTTGNPLVELRIAGYDPNLKVGKGLSAQSVQALTMCFKRLRFKQSAADGDDNIDLELGEVTLLPGGTSLTAVEIPAGTYTRIEFDLEDGCGTSRSLLVQNDNGTFSTTDGVEIRFDGTFTRGSGAQVLELNIQAISSALNTVTNDSQVRGQAESAGGDF